MQQKIILASQSPRRSMLLEWAAIPFIVIVKHANEHYDASMPVNDVPLFLASKKCKAVTESLQVQTEGQPGLNSQLPVLAADTVVVLDGEILGKPANKDEALDYLHRLSGRTHEVITGVVIQHQQRIIAFTEKTEVSFTSLTSTDINWYVDNFKPYDKAGGYAIQEWIGVTGINHIKGDYYNVMGLPVSRVVSELKKLPVAL